MVQDYLLFYPNNHIISSSSLIVAEITGRDRTLLMKFEQADRL